jgi:hypothetical protein
MKEEYNIVSKNVMSIPEKDEGKTSANTDLKLNAGNLQKLNELAL